MTTAASARAAEHSRAARDRILGHVMLAFEGHELPAAGMARLGEAPSAGVTMFRHLNVGAAADVRALTEAIQRAAGGFGPVLVAADQEGGQFLALGDDSTPFPGNMALGAADDPALTERVGAAMGAEMRALGVTLTYAPCADVASNPENIAIGIRSFGADPSLVARHTGAWVRGVRSAGVAATAKHFPGLGDVSLDSHLGLPVLNVTPERLEAVELAPFRAAIEAGVDVVMSAHIALPRLTGDPSLPATLSSDVMGDLLRGSLGFRGVTMTDALDMGALPQGPEQAIDAVAAIRAGIDALLLVADEAARLRIEAALVHAAARGLFHEAALAAADERLERLRSWLAGWAQPDLSVVGSDAHLALAAEASARAVTLVRNDTGLLPLRLPSEARVAAVMPRPRDLTPADTSSLVAPGLARALRQHRDGVVEIVVDNPPTDAGVAAARAQAAAADLIVVGTIGASYDPGQAALVDALLGTGVPTITLALRTPWDLASYPGAATHICTYGLLPPSMDALAAALSGRAPFPGRLPAPIEGLYPIGHGLAS
jgi:beta-N-acetylhexosaminidase